MASVYKRNGKWIASYLGADGLWHAKTAGTEKSMAMQIANKLENEARLRREGFITADQDVAKNAGGLPLTAHIADWLSAMLNRGATPKHAHLSAGRVSALAEGCKFDRLPEIHAGKVSSWLADRRKAGMSTATSNHHLVAAKGFCHWAVKDGRINSNPLAHIDGLNAKTDARHSRRALTASELIALLHSARNAPVRFGMTGEARATLYQLAVETGLRVSELRSLTAGSFSLTGESPSITVAAGYTKNRQHATLPLRMDTAAIMAEYLAGKTPRALAFTMPPNNKTASMLRADLADARQAYLNASQSPTERTDREGDTFCTYRDDAGRCADFHALRHTFISNLAAGGIHPKTAQQLARHSTITLTMDRYSHVFRGDVAKALDVLPSLTPDTEAESLRATGTTDTGSFQRAENALKTGGKNVPFGATACHQESSDMDATKPAPDAENTHVSRERPEWDSNPRIADLQSAPLVHSGIRPARG